MATESAFTLAAMAKGLNKATSINGVVAAGSSLSLTLAAHDGFRVNMDTASGSTVTLPASTGSGARFRFVTTVVPTTNSHKIQVANSTDVMRGVAFVTVTATGVTTPFSTVAASDTITMATHTGGVFVGEQVEVEDIAAGYWSVRAMHLGGATPATPFSAAV